MKNQLIINYKFFQSNLRIYLILKNLFDNNSLNE